MQRLTHWIQLWCPSRQPVHTHNTNKSFWTQLENLLFLWIYSNSHLSYTFSRHLPNNVYVWRNFSSLFFYKKVNVSWQPVKKKVALWNVINGLLRWIPKHVCFCKVLYNPRTVAANKQQTMCRCYTVMYIIYTCSRAFTIYRLYLFILFYTLKELSKFICFFRPFVCFCSVFFMWHRQIPLSFYNL